MAVMMMMGAMTKKKGGFGQTQKLCGCCCEMLVENDVVMLNDGVMTEMNEVSEIEERGR
jgi:hypothetical protein